jgi:UDP-N-acetylglucosamine 4-epimerase
MSDYLYAEAFHPGQLSGLRFLVTGGAGFIGSNLVEYLLHHGAGHVRVLDNLATGFQENLQGFTGDARFEFFQGDISQLSDCMAACEGMDYVLHQAALGSVPRSVEHPIGTNVANIDGFLNVLVAARDAGVKRMVYASSSSVYGDSPALPKREQEIGRPLSPYAVTKYVNELYARVFADTYGMEVIGLRYFNIFGPRQRPDGPYAAAIPLFMRALLDGQPAYINGDGEQSRDFTFVVNAVQANIKALFTPHREALGQVFNIACGDRVTINELYHMLRQHAGSSLMPHYREPRKGDIRDSLADIGKAKSLLNYHPSFDLKRGLGLTYAWFSGRYANP